jgi:hypothetical protein
MNHESTIQTKVQLFGRVNLAADLVRNRVGDGAAIEEKVVFFRPAQPSSIP